MDPAFAPHQTPIMGFDFSDPYHAPLKPRFYAFLAFLGTGIPAEAYRRVFPLKNRLLDGLYKMNKPIRPAPDLDTRRTSADGSDRKHSLKRTRHQRSGPSRCGIGPPT